LLPNGRSLPATSAPQLDALPSEGGGAGGAEGMAVTPRPAGELSFSCPTVCPRQSGTSMWCQFDCKGNSNNLIIHNLAVYPALLIHPQSGVLIPEWRIPVLVRIRVPPFISTTTSKRALQINQIKFNIFFLFGLAVWEKFNFQQPISLDFIKKVLYN